MILRGARQEYQLQRRL